MLTMRQLDSDHLHAAPSGRGIHERFVPVCAFVWPEFVGEGLVNPAGVVEGGEVCNWEEVDELADVWDV
jgi:hypothetical protein